MLGELNVVARFLSNSVIDRDVGNNSKQPVKNPELEQRPELQA